MPCPTLAQGFYVTECSMPYISHLLNPTILYGIHYLMYSHPHIRVSNHICLFQLFRLLFMVNIWTNRNILNILSITVYYTYKIVQVRAYNMHNSIELKYIHLYTSVIMPPTQPTGYIHKLYLVPCRCS